MGPRPYRRGNFCGIINTTIVSAALCAGERRMTLTLRDSIEKAPLLRAVAEYAAGRPARFHTPGHKGSPASPLAELLGRALPFDVTELPGTDSLYQADGPILAAERLAARTAGAGAALMSAGGATLCLQGMLGAVAGRGGGEIILARGSHRSAVNAAALLGLEPVWVWPRPFAGSGLPGRVCAADVAAALRAHPKAAAVLVTSPDYYGVMADIAAIARVCRPFGVPLLVDNAHGAHLLCLEGGARHPLRLGAAMTCDSAHKTLPVLTGGAWLYLRDGAAAPAARASMALFGSTSPSYLILLSLDIARAWMETEGAAAFAALRERVAGLRRLYASLGGFTPPEAEMDPVRLTLDAASLGRTGEQAARILRENGVEPEMSDGRHVVLLPGPFQPEEDFTRLERAMRRLPAGRPLPLPDMEPERPAVAMPLGQALRAPWEMVPADHAGGRVAAESCCPCPPGVPLAVPGERITENLAAAIKSYGIGCVKVVK